MCGHRLEPVRKPSGFLDPERNPYFLLAFLSCMIVIPILLVEIACLLLNAGNVLDMIGRTTVSFILAIPDPTVIFSTTGWMSRIYWMALVVTICACFAYALIRFIRGLADAVKDKDEAPVERTGLFWVCVMMSGMMFIQTLYFIVLYSLGYSVDSSWTDEYTNIQMMFLLADASVWEEIITRVLYIGVPMFVIVLATTRKLDSWKCIFGGFGMSRVAILLIVFSATVFGIAHNEGWGAGKILIAGLMGLAEGYLFVRFGLYASILLHFANDYLSSFSWLGTGLEGAVVLSLLILGIAAAAYMFKRMIESGKSMGKLPLLSKPPFE